MPNNSGTNQETSNASTELSSISEIQNPSITRQLGLGVDSKIKSKIWVNQFVDLCTLLGLKNKKKSFEIMENQEGECKIKTKRPTYEIRQVSQWAQAFLVFVGICAEKFPQEAPALMKYGDMVQKLRKQVGDEAAIYYDKNFREWLASNPSSSEIHSEALAVSLGLELVQLRLLVVIESSIRLHLSFFVTLHHQNTPVIVSTTGDFALENVALTHAPVRSAEGHTLEAM